ncbi:L-2-hydroxyglutarate oxidase [Nitratifractor sp.]
MKHCDYLVVGAGIVGLSLAREIRRRAPDASIVVLEKESAPAMHGSGRNSGVLHAGFYYSADSLKARFTREGNAWMRRFCEEEGLRIHHCGKVVVATNEAEDATLDVLMERGRANGVELEWWSVEELAERHPEATTLRRALHSPSTATVDPVEVTTKMAELAQQEGIELLTDCPYLGRGAKGVALSSQGEIGYGTLVNAAGLYADRIAREYGFSRHYTILPFKGIYLKDPGNRSGLSTNIYPVPNLANPFLGVHFTLTVDGDAKIGPTAIPAFWRENYRGVEGFDLRELAEILGREAQLFAGDAFGFRSLALEEMRKYRRSHLRRLARKLAPSLDLERYDTPSRPGIRAQLLDTRTMELVQDFFVEGDGESVHILNAVSPAFTSAVPFARWVCENFLFRERVKS